ncbi:phosphotriesterase family protein [Mesobacillus selenatarsenatis]|uniref:Parathion hydrolase n=1 Tax=Mesobacillus selenatarsenatis (strain DSM 18680 / JCM 14380 / FERM P-15431 / SF-1) TaxID=1321606 RepID=A0A0A8X3B3_MESS1|nr:phosphotriesterase [Mesobacillus selenatarsenatis]GAM14445.1 parathion hydrolase [Mesobacillus selenatarsenatis SF-1]
MTTINTVTGPIKSEQLGKTLIHEHFIFGYPGFQGDVTLGGFNEESALEEAINISRYMQSFGVKTVVDPTPNECGRNPEFLNKISEATGLQIICATGYYYEGEGATPYFKFRQALGTAEEEIYQMFKKELTDGIAGSAIKPGVIKLASSKDEITEYEKMFFRAGARVQQETGAVILTHTQEGTMGPEQVRLLIENGADPGKIIIGHMCGNTDPEYHKQVMDQGVRIGLDRFGIQGMVGAPFDQERVQTLLALLNEGYEDQILLAHDTVNIWLGRPPVMPEQAVKIMENWQPGHIFNNILPQLRESGVTETQIDKMLGENAVGLFNGAPAKVVS